MTLIGVSTGHCMNAVLCSKTWPLCDQRLTIGIENLVFNVSLYDFDWGKYLALILFYYQSCSCNQRLTIGSENILFNFSLYYLTLNNNISVISWLSVLFVEETGENHHPVTSHWQCYIEDTSLQARIKLTSIVMIDTECIGRCKH
jgi:hypothetical protein